MTDPVIPDEAVEAATRSFRAELFEEDSLLHPILAHSAQWEARHKMRAALTAALPHLRPLVEPVCDCYPGGFSPDSYEGPQHHCAVHGHGNDLPMTECPVCLNERALIATGTAIGHTLGRAEALALRCGCAVWPEHTLSHHARKEDS